MDMKKMLQLKKRKNFKKIKTKRFMFQPLQITYNDIFNDTQYKIVEQINEDEMYNVIYERFGYLDVVVHDDLRVERKKLQRGRPKEEKSKSYRITVRLDDELYELLQKYCQTKNMSESEAVRQLISELKWKRF